MRFLKNKIQKAQEAKEDKPEILVKFEDPVFSQNLAQSQQSPYSASTSPSSEQLQPKKRNRKTPTEKSRKTKQRPSKATKNMSINYGKAISTFAASHLALPYIEDLLNQHNMTNYEFKNFINSYKDNIKGIDSFKTLLQINEADEPKIKIYKEMFKIASEVFIKYFSVNWIIHGKLINKLLYLQFRGKMLRRVQNPDAFTYIKKRPTKRNRN